MVKNLTRVTRLEVPVLIASGLCFLSPDVESEHHLPGTRLHCQAKSDHRREMRQVLKRPDAGLEPLFLVSSKEQEFLHLLCFVFAC